MKFAWISALSVLTAVTPAVAAESPKVALETDKGRIVLELYPDKAPATVKNFLAYVDAGHYNGTIFHRVIPNFMVQGGGMTVSMKEKPTKPPVKNEADNGLKNLRGTIAMARTQVPDSATAQFFINTVDNDLADADELVRATTACRIPSRRSLRSHSRNASFAEPEQIGRAHV
jgi:cyclophilin family peptidyl-prolyl cis-trans isomerase